MPMYDRTLLQTIAQDKGDHTPSDTARRLKVARTTAWRLWHGHTAPSAALAAKVQLYYRIEAGALLIPTTKANR